MFIKSHLSPNSDFFFIWKLFPGSFQIWNWAAGEKVETKVGHAPYLLMSLNHSCDAFFWIGFASFDIFPDWFHIEGYLNGEFMIRGGVKS